jgi:hypothetical protein
MSRRCAVRGARAGKPRHLLAGITTGTRAVIAQKDVDARAVPVPARPAAVSPGTALSPGSRAGHPAAPSSRTRALPRKTSRTSGTGPGARPRPRPPAARPAPLPHRPPSRLLSRFYPQQHRRRILGRPRLVVFDRHKSGSSGPRLFCPGSDTRHSATG